MKIKVADVALVADNQCINNTGDEAMKNADSPANPCDIAPSMGAIAQAKGCGFNPPVTITHTGMTKREMIAMRILSGLSSHPDLMRSNDDGAHDTIAQAIAAQSVMLADCLLAELERTKCQS